MEAESADRNLPKTGENPAFIDSEEIDFGSEPFNEPEIAEKLVTDDEEFIEPETVDTADADNVAEEEQVVEESPDGQEGPAKPSGGQKKESSEPRLVRFPLSKVKQIMKLDPDVQIVSAEATFLVTRAAELFVQTLAKEAHTHTAAGKKKTMAKRDIDMTIESVDTLMFLEGAMNA